MVDGTQAGMVLSLIRYGGFKYIVGYVADEKLGVIVVVFSVCVKRNSRGCHLFTIDLKLSGKVIARAEINATANLMSGRFKYPDEQLMNFK